MNYILIGHKSSGKSTVGAAFATACNYSFIDLDQKLLKNFPQATSIAEAYEQVGETQFRALELETVLGLQSKNSVIATGGGTVLQAQAAQYLQSLGKFIYLHTPYEILYDRYLNNSKKGILAKQEQWQTIYIQRDSVYRNLADYLIHTAQKSILQLVEELMQLIEGEGTYGK